MFYLNKWFPVTIIVEVNSLEWVLSVNYTLVRKTIVEDASKRSKI